MAGGVDALLCVGRRGRQRSSQGAPTRARVDGQPPGRGRGGDRPTDRGQASGDDRQGAGRRDTLPGGPRGPEASRPPALHVVRGFRKGKYMTRWVAATSRAPGMPPRGQAQVPGGRGVRRLPPPWRTVGGPQSLARKGRATPPSPSACRLHFESQPRAEWLLPSRLPSRMTHVRERRQDGLAESQPRGGTPSKTRSPPALLPAGRPRGAHHVTQSFAPQELSAITFAKFVQIRRGESTWLCPLLCHPTVACARGPVEARAGRAGFRRTQPASGASTPAGTVPMRRGHPGNALDCVLVRLACAQPPPCRVLTWLGELW